MTAMLFSPRCVKNDSCGNFLDILFTYIYSDIITRALIQYKDAMILSVQAGKLALARSPMRVKIWPGEWKTGLDEWNFV